MKLERADSKHPQLVYESRVIRCIHSLEAPALGFPIVRWIGQVSSDYLALVMTCLGPSLEDLFNFCERRFSLKTVLMVADQMLERIEFLHARHFIHRCVRRNG